MTAWVQVYLGTQVLIVLGWLLSRFVATRLGATAAVGVTRIFLGATVALPVLWWCVGTSSAWRPAPQVFDALDAAGAGVLVPPISAATRSLHAAVTQATQPGWWWMVLAVAAALGSVAVLRAWWTLGGIIDRAQADGEVDGIEVRVSHEVAVPFAARLPGRRVVVLDTITASDPDDRRISLAHERQHHAQRDTLFTYAHALLRVVGVLNPAAWLWARELEELEELATDDAVVHELGVSARDYCQCLLRAAERERDTPSPTFAVSLTSRGARSLLHRRIQTLTHTRRGSAGLVPLAVAGLATMTVTAWTSHRFLHQDGIADVALERLTHATDDVPRPLIRDALTTIAGNVESVRFLREGVERSDRWRGSIAQKLEARGLPRELAAIPLIESGYANLEADPSASALGAGLWMFVPQTAMAYGLNVEPGLDQRLDPELQTEVALRLLVDLHMEFGSWPLAITAYNQGRIVVKNAIRDQDTDDAWELIERGVIRPYAAQVYAASLLLDDPAALDLQDPWL